MSLSTIAILILSYTSAYATQNFTLEAWKFAGLGQGGVVEEEGDDEDQVYICLKNGKPLKVLGLEMIDSDDISEEGIVCTPEPSSIFGLITLGSILAGAKILQK
ncbi:PEP-CTERM sorting domain-containing protein [Okeania sp.]|uniref:PEP-CTERM sorting domain-containing protein n=1 Tax=Okeania sp. TaxID=3100323 RepID=UPI002B4B8B8A|nr:PEP-CTERM sorting domain-containing protein [Okeania sp.]MEB3342864.1 PEP-CTERM sorting domain-containing protein [Okeania sp.]